SPSDLLSAVKQHKPKLCVVAEASNVTGEILDLQGVAQICKEHGVLLIVDAAQSAGFTDQQIDELEIGIWCASGHKGLLGAPGIGLLYVAPHVVLQPLVAGGTGSNSERLEMPQAFPDHLEAGTLNVPAVAALHAGVTWLQEKGLEHIRRHEQD